MRAPRRAPPAVIVPCLMLVLAGLAGPASDTAGAPGHRRRERRGPAAATRWAPAPETLQDGRVRLTWIDFGPSGNEVAGTLPDDGATPNRSWAWTGGLVRMVRREAPTQPRFVRDLIEGYDATFRMSVEGVGPWTITLTAGDPATKRGPFDIVVGDSVVARDIRTPAGAMRDIPVPVRPVGGEISLRILAHDCTGWGVAGLAVYAPAGSTMTSALFTGPQPAPYDTASATDTREMALRRLGTLCQELSNWRPAEGVFSRRGAWYESSYPVRTLLAGGRLLDRSDYVDMAVQSVDRFVSEQRADGSWSAMIFGPAGCAAARAEIERTATANLADVGTMALAAAVTAGMVEDPRAAGWRAALVRYADDIVLPCQLESGAFPNRLWAGTDFHFPYTVATGVQASFLSALAALTGEARYQAAADRAAGYLVDNIGADGRMTFHPFDRERPTVLESIRFGDLYYPIEGMIWARRYTKDSALAARLDQGLNHWLWGRAGLAGWVTVHGLWRATDLWEASKQGALLFVLESCAGQAVAHDPGPPWRQAETAAWIAQVSSFLCDPVQSAGIGLGWDPASPEGNYAFAATGFTGIGLAALVDPGAVFPPTAR